MATLAGLADYCAVIEVRLPINRCMTSIAGLCSCYMARVFTCGDNTVMAAFASADYLIVIDALSGAPGKARMAGGAHVAARYVGCRFARCIDVVMAGTARYAGYGVVIEVHRPIRC